MNMREMLAALVMLAMCAAHGECDVTLAEGWRFAMDATQKADCSAEAFDDSAWQSVRVPHDWAIGGPFLRDEPSGMTGRLPWKGVGWYRLAFDVPASAAGQCAFLDFDGAMAAPEVYVNGRKAGGWDYGYASFRVDATPFVRTGRNTLAVRLSTLHLAARWYPGAGLYRRVTLRMRDKAHFAHDGIFVTTPEVGRDRALVKVTWETEGAAKDASVTVRIVRNGRAVAEATEPAVRGVTFLSVEKPDLWDVDSPALYEAEVSLADRVGAHVSRERIRFGIREIAFPVADDPNDRAANGFHLNGRRVQLKGVNLHSDLGLLGMAFDRSAARRQLHLMKEMGANALRTSHNPPAPELLDLCDEMGILVWDECFDKWNAYGGRRDDQSLEEYVARNLVAFVKRDRNHPSVIVWSIGNEIWEWDPDNPIRKPDNPLFDRGPWGQTKVRNAFFRDQVRLVDATRPVGNGNSPHVNEQRVLDLGIFDPLDLTGWNYFRSYVPVKKKYPRKPIIFSESASAVSSYGFYCENPLGGMKDFPRGGVAQVDSRDFQSTLDTVDEVFDWMERDAYCCGEFVWTGIDYLGEPYPYEKEARSSYFGIVDLMGVPKDRYWLCRSHWRTDARTLHISPDSWTFPGREGRNTPVVVYTDGDEAELFLNGRSLGRRRKGEHVALPPAMTNDHFKAFCRYRLMWLDVPYEPGELKAVAYKDGRMTGEKTLRTAGAVAELRLFAEPLAGKDEDELIWVHAEAYDGSGVRVPDATNAVAFSLEGPGRILGVGNGDACEYVPFSDASGHRLFGGRATAVVRREGCGEIRVLASLGSGAKPFCCKVPDADKDAPFLVASNGVPKADIVIPAKPLDAVRYAADELKYHLDKAFGADFKIVAEDACAGGGMRYHFFLGDTKAAKAAGIPGRELKPDERFLKRKGDGIYLVGRDSGISYADIPNTRTVRSLGTLYAVYDFLETELKVMWIWPGETGEVIPKRSSLAVRTLERGGVEPLDERFFYGTIGGEKIGFSSRQACDRFFAAQTKFLVRHRHGRRLNTVSGHSFGDWWKRFGKDHPEYFNLLPDGTRRPLHNPTLVTMCCAEPGVWKQKAADWNEWWQKTGRNGGFEPWVNCCENDSAGLCTCAKCRAWDPPDPRFGRHPYWKGGLTREFLDSLWKERGPNHGEWALSWLVGDNRWDIPEHDSNVKPVAPLSDRYANFYNHIQAEVAKYEPRARVIGYAYENYVEAPQMTKVDPRVIIEYVPRSYLPYDKTESEFFRKHWMGWKKAGVKDFIYRPNYMLACGGYHLDQGRLILSDFAFAYTNGMMSCKFDSLRGSWAAHALMDYALIRAMRDPLHGYDRARSEMLSAFGKAQGEVAEFLDGVRAHSEHWTFADIRKMSWANHTGAQGGGSHGNCGAILGEYLDDRFFADGYAKLDRAEKAADGDVAAVARIEFLRKGLRNAELTRAVRIAQKDWQKSGDDAGKKAAFDAAFKAMNDYRASAEGDFVCNFADSAVSERNSMQWPHQYIKE